MNPLCFEDLLSILSNCQGLLQDEPADPTPLALYLRVLKNIGESITSKFFKAKNFNLPSPCPLPAPNSFRFLAPICWKRVVLLHLSPHQHLAEIFTLKLDAGEGNQRGGGYEQIVIFLNI